MSTDVEGAFNRLENGDSSAEVADRLNAEGIAEEEGAFPDVPVAAEPQATTCPARPCRRLAFTLFSQYG